MKGRLALFGGEKATLVEIAHRLGRKALQEVPATAQPDTILAGIGIARKFEGDESLAFDAPGVGVFFRCEDLECVSLEGVNTAEFEESTKKLGWALPGLRPAKPCPVAATDTAAPAMAN